MVSPVTKSIEYFDSMHGPTKQPVTNIKRWLSSELGEFFNESEWNVWEDPAYPG